MLDQLNKHILAIAQGSPGIKFGIRANPMILSVLEHPNIKVKVIEKLQGYTKFQPFQHLFFFASLDEVKKDCGNAWKDINNRSLFFDKPT